MVSPLDLLNKNNWDEKETSLARYKICLECPEFFKPTKTCKKCGCFMAAKTKLKDAECPIGKW